MSLIVVSGGHAWRKPRWRPGVALINDRRRLLVMQLAYIGQFRVGTLVLAAAGTAVAVGECAIASRVAEGLVILSAAISASSLPLMGAAFARRERAALTDIFSRSYRLGLVAIAPMLAILQTPANAASTVPDGPA